MNGGREHCRNQGFCSNDHVLACLGLGEKPMQEAAYGSKHAHSFTNFSVVF